MGLQEISQRKVRKAAEETGLDLIRVMRHSNNLWFGWVREGEGHWHADIYPGSWLWEYQPGCEFSSCRQNRYGPGVLPSDQRVIALHERAEEERRYLALLKEAEWHDLTGAWEQVTKAQFGID